MRHRRITKVRGLPLMLVMVRVVGLTVATPHGSPSAVTTAWLTH